MFVFLNICHCIYVYSLICDKYMFYSWVPAGTSHILTIFSSVCSIQIHHIDEKKIKSSINIFTIWYQGGYFFLATLRHLECCEDDERKNRTEEGWLGWEKATLLYYIDTWLTKEKNTARLFFKQNVYEKAPSS